MITTEQVVNSTPQIYGDSVLTFLRRSDVEYQLRSLGVDQKSAEERVAAITDEEIQALVGKLDSLYAGGQYVPPLGAVGAVSGVGGGYGGAGGGYGGAGGAVAILGVGLATFLIWMSEQTNAGNPDHMTSNPAPMDPNRKISAQDCTKPMVFDGGNLHCK